MHPRFREMDWIEENEKGEQRLQRKMLLCDTQWNETQEEEDRQKEKME